MKKKLLLPITTLLVTGIALSSCSTIKQDVEKRRQDRENSAETTVEETAAADTTETEATETEETTAEATTTEASEVEPSVITVESNMYSDEEAPIVVDWDNYQSPTQTTNVFTRMSEEQINDFAPSEEYGYVMPFIGVRSEGELKTPYAEEGEVRTMYKFGLCDSNGRIVTDAVFDGITLLSRCYYLEKGDYPDTKYGLINLTGTIYTGCIYDSIHMTYYGEDQLLFAKSKGEMTVYDNDLNVLKTLKYNADLGSNKLLGSDSDYYVAAVIGDNRIVLNSDFEDKLYLDITTGEVADYSPWTWFEEFNLLITSTGQGDEISYQLRDGQGNVIADDFTKCAFNTPYPVLKDKWEKWHIFDGEGEDRYSYKTSTMPTIRKVEGGLLIKVDENSWRLLDEDFNVVDYGIKNVLNINGDKKYLYIKDNLEVKDYFTDKTVFEGYLDDSILYGFDDITAMSSRQSDRTYKEIAFSNDKTVNIRGAVNLRFTKDKSTGKLYAISFFDDRVQLYCVDDDITTVIYAPIVQYASYDAIISDNRYYLMGPNVRAIYDITDPGSVGTIFYYEPLVLADD